MDRALLISFKFIELRITTIGNTKIESNKLDDATWHKMLDDPVAKLVFVPAIDKQHPALAFAK